MWYSLTSDDRVGASLVPRPLIKGGRGLGTIDRFS